MLVRRLSIIVCILLPWLGSFAETETPKEGADTTPAKVSHTAAAETRVTAAQTNVVDKTKKLAAATAALKQAVDANQTAAVPELTGNEAGARKELELAEEELELAKKARVDAPLADLVERRGDAVTTAEKAVQTAEAEVARLTKSIETNKVAMDAKKEDEAKKPFKEIDTKLKDELAKAKATLATAEADLAAAQDGQRAALAIKTADELGAPASMKEIYDTLKKTSANLPAQYVFLQAGLLSLNPYRIVSKDAGLVMETSGDSDVRPYLEATFRHRTAWLDSDDWVFADEKMPLASTKQLAPLNIVAAMLDWPINGIAHCFTDGKAERPRDDGDPDYVSRFVNFVFGEADLIPRDYEVRVGLVGAVGQDDAASPTVAGSGDTYVETSLGWRLLTAGCSADTNLLKTGNLHATLNFEALGGIVTERNFQDVHDYQAIGLATVWGITNNQDQPKRRTELIAGAYWGKLEVPQLVAESEVPDDLKGQKVVLGRNGDVDFANADAMMVRVDMHVPAGKDGFFIVSGRYWTGLSDFEPWTLSVGYSLPLDGK